MQEVARTELVSRDYLSQNRRLSVLEGAHRVAECTQFVHRIIVHGS